MNQILLSVNHSDWLTKVPSDYGKVLNHVRIERKRAIAQSTCKRELLNSVEVVKGIIKAETAEISAEDLIGNYSDVNHILVPVSGSDVNLKACKLVIRDTENRKVSLKFESAKPVMIPQFRLIEKYAGVFYAVQTAPIHTIAYVCKPHEFISVVLANIASKRFLDSKFEVTNRDFNMRLAEMLTCKIDYIPRNKRNRVIGKTIHLKPLYKV